MIYLDNKYTRCYFSIIERAKSRTLECYVEKHHIIPKSLGGNNRNDNIVSLTAREHFICHWLLTKMLEEGKLKWKMLYAFGAFLQKNKSQDRLIITGRKYELLKKAGSIARSNFNKGNTYSLGYKHSEESIQKRKESMLGYVRPIEVVEKQAKTMREKYQTQDYIHKGKTYEEIYGAEEAEKRKAKLRGKKGPRNNPTKKHDVVTCPHCRKTGGAGNMRRYHFDNCAFQKLEVLSHS